MNTHLKQVTIGGLVLSVLAGASVVSVRAAGPLIVFDHTAIRWAQRTISGGPLGTTTVTADASGKRTVFYHVDSGPLGPLSNAYATHLVDRIFGEYTDIPTADIDFVDAGPLRDPDTGAVVDVDGSNFGKFLDVTLQNPIIFDSDGGITGTGGVLGFFGTIALADCGGSLGPSCSVAEGIVVLNGSVMNAPFFFPPPSFLGVFTHEFGHFAGPIDHAQINGNIARRGTGAVLPPGFTTAGQIYDLFAPFTETMFPFLLGAPASSTFPLNSGYFIATMDQDTINSMSNLYPTAEYLRTTGSIDGRVFFRSGDTKVPVDGMNVVARRISQGSYPPTPDTLAFPASPAFDADGVPAAPPPQAATDPLATASSAVTGLDFGFGAYRVQGLPPGDYLVELQRINPSAIGGSGIGPLSLQPTLPVNEEYYDGNGHPTSNVVTQFTPVRVSAGNVRHSIDLEINGLDTSEPRHVGEDASHMTAATAQALPSLPIMVQGSVAATDPSAVSIDFGGGQLAPVQDLYKVAVSLPTPKVVWISLEPIGEGASFDADLDLYMFLAPPTPVTPFGAVTRYSVTPTAHELIGVRLSGAGTLYLGVSGFAGSAKYRLRVLLEKP